MKYESADGGKGGYPFNISLPRRQAPENRFSKLSSMKHIFSPGTSEYE